MANMYDINALSWTVQENPEWFTRAVFGGRLVNGGYISVLTGIKGDELLSQIDLNGKVLQGDGKDCAWTPNQIIKLSEKKATVKTFKINLEQCIDELENKRTLYQLSAGAQNDELPPELETATLFLLSLALSNEIEEMIISGNSNFDPNQFDGVEFILTFSDDSIQIAGVTLAKANVLDQIEKVYNAIPENVLQSEDAGTLYILCSYAVRRYIRAALADKNNMVIAASWSVDETDKKNPRLYYLGVEIVPVKGIGANTLIAYDKTNIYLLTDMLADLENIELGQFSAPHDDKVFIKGRLRLGVVIPFEDECVISASGITTDRLEPAPNIIVPVTSYVFKAEGGELKCDITYPAGSVATMNIPPDLVAKGVGGSFGAPSTVGGITSQRITITAPNNTGANEPITGVIWMSTDTMPDRKVCLTVDVRTDEITQIVP